jgi:hypothetical protein
MTDDVRVSIDQQHEHITLWLRDWLHGGMQKPITLTVYEALRIYQELDGILGKPERKTESW